MAYETARQLQARGRTIAFLGLFEAYLPNPVSVLPWGLYCRSSYVFLKGRVRHHFHHLWRLRGEELRDYLRERCLYLPARTSRLCRGLMIRLGLHQAPTIAAPLVPTEDYFAHLTVSYRPKPFAGGVTLFLGEENCRLADEEWRCLVSGEVSVRQVPGKHAELLSSQHVKALAEVFKACLLEAQTRAPAGKGSFRP